MSDWLGVLREYRERSEEDNRRDGEPPPTDEEILAGMVYEAITDFIERDEFRLIADLLDEDYQYEVAVSNWVDGRRPEADAVEKSLGKVL